MVIMTAKVSKRKLLIVLVLLVLAAAVLITCLKKAGSSEPPHEPLIAAAVKILAGLLVHKDLALRQSKLLQRDELPQLVLFPRRNPRIPIIHLSYLLKKEKIRTTLIEWFGFPVFVTGSDFFDAVLQNCDEAVAVDL